MTRIIPTNAPINYQLSQAGVVFATDQTIVGDITATTSDIIQSADGNEFLGLIAGDSDQYPPLPETGNLCEAGVLYAWNNGVVNCRQSHIRTIFPPEDTPALFSVYRADGGETLEWIVGEQVQVGNIRVYETVTYRCIQAHQTQDNWTPPLTPTLWAVEQVGISEWVQPTGAHDAYQIGDQVTHNGATWESDYDANVWEPGVFGWTEI